jgi:hypothetical protein
MKKLVIASIFALAAVLVGASAAQAYTFSKYLTVGSTGADVSALQQWLIDSGYSIPSISSGAASKGYFGQQTKAAVVKYQAAVGLPSTGFVGPLTVAKLNGVASSMPAPTASCPAGYTCTPTAGTPVTVTPDSGVVTPGTDGSVTVSLSSYASNVTIKKGETKDMVAVKLQATAAPVAVTRFDVRFNARPWLYFGVITLKDSNGAVIATKNLSSAADATEITVGSDYLVRFDNINAVITPGTDRILVVSGSVLSVTDKIVTGTDVSVIVSVPNSSIRTINGKGYTDSIGLGTVAQSGTTGRTATLSASGSVANILGRISPSTPDTRIVNTSTNGETMGVVLGKFDLKSENRASTINTLTFTLKDNGGNKPWSTILKRVYLSDGSKTYQVDSVATSSVFSNLTINLPQDEWKTLVVSADVADQDDFSNGAMVSSSITVNTTNIVGIDINFTNVTASGVNEVVSNNMTFLQNGASITNMSAIATVLDNGSSKSKTASLTYSFTFNNTGTSDLYLSANPSVALATSSTVSTAASTTLTTGFVTTSPASVSGDSGALTNAGYYRVPSGTARTFVFSGTLDNTNGTNGIHSASITKVYFDDDTTGLQEFNVNFGLEKLISNVVGI